MLERVASADRDPPAKRPPVKCGTRPLTARRKVDFPAPVAPTASANDPSSIASVDVVQGRAIAVRDT